MKSKILDNRFDDVAGNFADSLRKNREKEIAARRELGFAVEQFARITYNERTLNYPFTLNDNAREKEVWQTVDNLVREYEKKGARRCLVVINNYGISVQIPIEENIKM